MTKPPRPFLFFLFALDSRSTGIVLSPEPWRCTRRRRLRQRWGWRTSRPPGPAPSSCSISSRRPTCSIGLEVGEWTWRQVWLIPRRTPTPGALLSPLPHIRVVLFVAIRCCPGFSAIISAASRVCLLSAKLVINPRKAWFCVASL